MDLAGRLLLGGPFLFLPFGVPCLARAGPDMQKGRPEGRPCLFGSRCQARIIARLRLVRMASTTAPAQTSAAAHHSPPPISAMPINPACTT